MADKTNSDVDRALEAFGGSTLKYRSFGAATIKPAVRPAETVTAGQPTVAPLPAPYPLQPGAAPLAPIAPLPPPHAAGAPAATSAPVAFAPAPLPASQGGGLSKVFPLLGAAMPDAAGLPVGGSAPAPLRDDTDLAAGFRPTQPLEQPWVPPPVDTSPAPAPYAGPVAPAPAASAPAMPVAPILAAPSSGAPVSPFPSPLPQPTSMTAPAPNGASGEDFARAERGRGAPELDPRVSYPADAVDDPSALPSLAAHMPAPQSDVVGERQDGRAAALFAPSSGGPDRRSLAEMFRVLAAHADSPRWQSNAVRSLDGDAGLFRRL